MGNMPYYNQYPNDPPPPPTYEQPPPPHKKKHVGMWVTVAALVVLIIILIAAIAGASKDPSVPGTIAPHTATAQAAKAHTKAATTKPVTPQIGAGTFLVGTDVQPGHYKTTGAAPSSIMLCYWHTAKDDGGQDIITQGVANKEDEPGRVTLKTGEYFRTSGCKPWTKQQ